MPTAFDRVKELKKFMAREEDELSYTETTTKMNRYVVTHFQIHFHKSLFSFLLFSFCSGFS